MVLKSFYTFLLFFGLCYSVSGQYYSRTHLDSIQHAFSSQKGKEQINTCLLLSDVYEMFSLDTAIIYAQKAQHDAEEIDYTWAYYKGLYCQAKAEYYKKPIGEVKPIVEKCVHWFEQNNYEVDEVYAKFLLVNIIGSLDGKEKAGGEVEKIFEKVDRLNNNQLKGLGWKCRRYYGNHLVEGNKKWNALDSANYYFTLIKDSVNMISMNLYSNLSINGSKKAMEYCSKSFLKARKWGNSKLLAEAMWYTGLGHASWKRTDSAIYSLNQAIRFSKQQGNIRSVINSKGIKGYAYEKVDSLDLALITYKQAIEMCNQIEESSRIIELRHQIVYINSKLGRHEEAINNLMEQIELTDKLNDVYQMNASKRLLADNYLETGQYDKAIPLYNEVLSWLNDALEGQVKLKMRGNIYYALGALYKKKKEHQKSRACLRLAVSDLEKKHQSAIHADASIVLSYLEEEYVDSAKLHFLQIEDSHIKERLEKNTSFYFAKGKLNAVLGNHKIAAETIEHYLVLGDRTLNLGDKKEAYHLLYSVYDAMNKSDKALEAYINYNTIDDSLRASKVVENTKQIQANYELSLKDVEIEGLNKEKQLQALTLEQQKNNLRLNQLYIIALILLILFVITLAYVFSRRTKNKKDREKLELKAALELENLQAVQKAEIAETKNSLFANVSHEFRTPLTLIKVPLEKYRATKASTSDQPIFDSVLNNTDELLKMVDELLDVSKVETGELELNKTSFSLSHFFGLLRTHFSLIFKEKAIEFVWNNKLAQDLFIGDEKRLKIVFNNLLKNAYNHSPEGGKVVCFMEVIENEDQQELCFSITNKGDNISEKDLPHIFDRFYRANESKYVGNGIGLSLSKQIVELHGGEIEVDNSKEGEVTFIVRILGDAIQENNSDIPEVTEIVGNSNIKVEEKLPSSLKENQSTLLVVEDNEEMRDLLKVSLEEDFNLSFAEDGVIGERMASEIQPDLILSDVMMPNKDGLELLSSIRTNFETSHIPVVLLTAKASVESRISGLNQDADDYIAKPFNEEDLKARLHNLLRQRKRLQTIFNENPLVFDKKIKTNPLDEAFLIKSREVLEAHFSNGDFQVNEFCAELALNRNSVNNKIKALTNQSTALYIRNFRLEKAAKMLVETQQPIVEIAMDTGFNNPQTFNKVFKERFEKTPSEYRKK